MDKLKLIRVKIFALITILRTDSVLERELALAITSLQRSRMFLGKVIEELFPGNDPYPESINPESDVIEPRADAEQYTYPPIDPLMTRIGRIKLLRKYIEELVEDIKNHNLVAPNFTDLVSDNELAGVFYTTSLISLAEAKMWLGEELGNIRDRSSGPEIGRRDSEFIGELADTKPGPAIIDELTPLTKEQNDWLNKRKNPDVNSSQEKKDHEKDSEGYLRPKQ